MHARHGKGRTRPRSRSPKSSARHPRQCSGPRVPDRGLIARRLGGLRRPPRKKFLTAVHVLQNNNRKKIFHFPEVPKNSISFNTAPHTQAQRRWSFKPGDEQAKTPSTQGEGRRGPVVGLRVLDAGNMIAGPLYPHSSPISARTSSKIELPGIGDSMRHWTPMKEGRSLWWKVIGRNKRLITAGAFEAARSNVVQGSSAIRTSSSRISGRARSSAGDSASPSSRRSIPAS